MWYEPALIDAVAGEAAGQVIVDAAGGHLVQRQRYHLEEMLLGLALPKAQQQLQVHAVREFGGGAEAAVAGVERALQGARGVVEDLRGRVGRYTLTPALSQRERGRSGRTLIALFLDRLQIAGQLAGLLEHAFAAISPGVIDGNENLLEAGHAHARRRRPVGAAVERLQVGREENGHRP